MSLNTPKGQSADLISLFFSLPVLLMVTSTGKRQSNDQGTDDKRSPVCHNHTHTCSQLRVSTQLNWPLCLLAVTENQKQVLQIKSLPVTSGMTLVKETFVILVTVNSWLGLWNDHCHSSIHSLAIMLIPPGLLVGWSQSHLNGWGYTLACRQSITGQFKITR